MSRSFTLTVSMGNDAMQSPYDVARMLRKQAERIENACDRQRITGTRTTALIADVNGNTIGDWAFDDGSHCPHNNQYITDTGTIGCDDCGDKDIE